MRTQRGSSLAETAASMALLFPLLVMVLFVMAEASYAYFLKATLSEASRTAARNLAIAYGRNSTIANNRTLEDATVFDNVRISNVVNANEQFDDPVWQTDNHPYTVSVNTRYLSGQFGLPLFPHPDPLNLGNNWVIQAHCTYKLE